MPRSIFRSSRPSRQPRPPQWLLALAMLPLLLAGRSAVAQGTSGVFPDPISGRELTGYAQILGLSDQQRLAIDAHHDEYLVSFEKLRSGDMEAYIADSGNIMRSLFGSPDSAQVKKEIDRLNRLMGRIRSLDEQLFDQILAVLNETQASAMPRARQSRARTRYRAGLVRYVGYANPGARVDLSDLVRELDLSLDERQQITPLVLAYEGQLTSLARRLYEETQRMFLGMVKKIEELMGSAESGRDAGRRRWQSFRDIWAESSGDMLQAATAISGLNRRSFSGFGVVLTEEPMRRLEDEYYRRAYEDVHKGMDTAIAKFDAALRLPDLGRDTVSAVEAARAVIRDRQDRLARQMIDLWEVVRRKGAGLRFGGGQRLPEQDRIDELEATRDAANERAIAELNALLDPRHAAILAREDDDDDDEPAGAVGMSFSGGRGTVRIGARRAGGNAGASARTMVEPGPDPFLPGPISERERRRYATLLALDANEEAVLETIHSGYLDDFETLREARIDPIIEAGRTMWAIDGSGGITPPTTADISRVYDLRKQALDAIMALDAKFFEQIALALLTDDDTDGVRGLKRSRLARDRIVFNRGDSAGGTASRMLGRTRRWMNTDRDRTETTIDLTALLETQRLDPAEIEAARDILIRYEEDIAAAFRARYEVAIAYQRAVEQVGAGAAALRERGDWRRGGPGGELTQMLETTGTDLRARGKAIVELNRSTLEAIAGALGDGSAAALRRGYRRASHPEVYDDPGAAGPVLQNALRLEDLTPSQRARISDLLADYSAPYDDTSEQMADLRTAMAETGGGRRGGDWTRRREIQNQLERLQFNRGELNDRTLRQLRGVLEETQVQRLGLGGDLP